MGISTIKTVVVTTALAEPLAGKVDAADLGALASLDTVGSTQIDANAVTNAKLAQMAQATIKGRASGAGTGDPVDLTATQTRTILNVEDGADVTDTANVTAAGALMDSEVASLSGIKTLIVPDNTTISAFAKTVLDDADAAAMRTTLDAAGNDDVTALEAMDTSIVDLIANDPRHGAVLTDEFIWSAGGNAVTPEGYLSPSIKMVDGSTWAYDANLQPRLFVQDDGSFNAAFGRAFLSDEYSQVFASDLTGNINLAVRYDGSVQSRAGKPILSEWAGLATDDDFMIVRYRADGRVAVGPVPNVDWRVQLRGVDDDNLHVYLYGPGRAEVKVTSTAAPYRGAKVEGLVLSYLDMTSGIGVETEVSLYAQTALSSGIATVTHLIGTGQSLSNGQSSTPVLTTAAFDAGRAVMFTAGVKATGTAQSGGFINEVITAADVATFVNAYETGTETPMSETARTWLSGEASTMGALISTHGIGGASYTLIKKGTVPYENMMIAIRRAYFLCALLGLEYSCPYLLVVHGEANYAVSKATYLGYLNEWRSDFTTDRNAITGDTSDAILVVDQISNWTAYGVATSEVPLAQLQVELDDPTTAICYSAKYMLPTADGIHLTNASSVNLGARRGRALKQLEDGNYSGGLYMLSAVRTGANVVITFNMPYGGDPIDLYTGLVSNPGNYGIEWSDAGDGNSVTISSVTVTATDKITVVLSATPTGTAQKIGIAITGTPTANAGPTTGARSCIRSATADVDSQSGAMDHYALHQLIDVTT